MRASTALLTKQVLFSHYEEARKRAEIFLVEAEEGLGRVCSQTAKTGLYD